MSASKVQPMKRKQSFRPEDQVTKAVSRKQARKLSKQLRNQQRMEKDTCRYSAYMEA